MAFSNTERRAYVEPEGNFGGNRLDTLHESLVAIRRILRATENNAKDLGKATNLSTSQLLVLQAVEEVGEMTVGEITAEVKLAQASVTELVDRLQTKQLVVRQRGDTDKRKVYVRLSDEGQSILDRAPRALHDRFSERFIRLDTWEQTMILSVLQRVATMMDASDIDAAPLLDTGHVHQEPKETRK